MNENKTRPVEVGEFLRVTIWNVEGMALAVRPSEDWGGSVDAIEVLLEVIPDDPNPRWYRLEPDQYEVIG